MKNTKEDSDKTSARQGVQRVVAEPLKIGASTPYDFSGRNLTAYGGLLPVATMLEKLGFQQLLEETLTIGRRTRAMPAYRFVLGMVLVLYVGFSRLNHLRFVEREPMLTGILKVPRVPPQCTFWRFLAALHLSMAGRLLRVQQILRQRVWQTAHVDLKTIPLDTDTTVNTLFGHQMGGRKGYNPKNKGKKSYQPMLTFLAETREYIGGELRNGDRPTGAQIARHLESVFAALPKGIETMCARADSGFYCAEAVQAYAKAGVQFILSARKTSRLIDELRAAQWTGSPKTDADGQCEFRYQPEGWDQAYRFIALRYEKKKAATAEGQPEQYQLFDTPEYSYRVFVTNMREGIALLTWFYNQRAGAENLIKEAKNDAGMADHPSGRWAMNCIFFQLAMLAYNLNCWLMLFNREEQATLETLGHTTLATSRLRFLFLAARIWRHAGRIGISYSDHYAEQSLFDRLMLRLRAIAASADGYLPVISAALRC
ncbi:MAG: IS1380 family transposase [Bryobacterales bacterium]|nr:IS1380 family transposase [Bryobacterales bacterium]